MGIISKITRLRKNKEFSYEPRYYKGEGSPYKLEHKFDKFRSTVETPRGIKGKLSNALQDTRNTADRNTKIRLAVIIAILVFIFLYIIDFDLSIFFGQ